MNEREFRLRPRKPAARNERAAWASAYKILMHYARMSGRRSPKRSINARRFHDQRCAVRVMYVKNTIRGQWRAHGRYIARESATEQGSSKAVGFDDNAESIDIAERLDAWQKAGDERLWKLIVSPEFGDRVDLKRLTRDLMSRIEKDLGTPLVWLAVAHYNTEHPHVHIALRGVGAEGGSLHLSRNYIKRGIREVAEDFCTRQLGYRSELDAAVAQRREVHAHRYTSLDRIIEKANSGDQPFLTIATNPSGRLIERNTAQRLVVLESMGLASSIGPNLWRVRSDLENILRTMQRSADRQKTLSAHGALISDQRLPLTVLDFRHLTAVEGRILVHGEEDTGRRYLMLEGTDASVHYVYYTREMEAARSRSGLRVNSFVRLRKLFADGRPRLEIDELGDADSVLRNRRFLRETAQRLMRRAIIPQEDGWGGWLGRYQKALAEAASDVLSRAAQRDKRQDRGR